jgi:hypothetical protein
LLKNPVLNLLQSVSMQSDSVTSSEDEESDSDAYEEKIEEIWREDRREGRKQEEIDRPSIVGTCC